jgi:hypothetical protein
MMGHDRGGSLIEFVFCMNKDMNYAAVKILTTEWSDVISDNI